MKTETVSFTLFSLIDIWGFLKGDNPIIHQEFTSTNCVYRKRNCIPEENPKTQLVWNSVPHQAELYKSLGLFNVTQIKSYVIIGELAVGGGIIRNEGQSMLLDNGLVLHKDGKLDKDFKKFSQKFAKETTHSVQRELLEGRLGVMMLEEEQKLATLSALMCRMDQTIQKLQTMITKHLPDISDEFLYGGPGRIAQRVGDGILIKKCRKITQFNVTWDRRRNGSCSHLLPIQAAELGPAYLELETRRVFRSSPQINCTKRAGFFVKDKRGIFWKYEVNQGFTRIQPKILKQTVGGRVVPVLGTFNEKLVRHMDHAPHRNNLLNFLAARQDAVQQLENFKTQGGGSITEGVMGAISATIKGAGDAGAEIIGAIAKGLETTSTGVGNATANIIGATGTALKSIVQALGGIPGIILFVGEAGIILYLWKQHGTGTSKKRPEIVVMTPQTPKTNLCEFPPTTDPPAIPVRISYVGKRRECETIA